LIIERSEHNEVKSSVYIKEITSRLHQIANTSMIKPMNESDIDIKLNQGSIKSSNKSIIKTISTI
jgi:hypothetical protein